MKAFQKTTATPTPHPLLKILPEPTTEALNSMVERVKRPRSTGSHRNRRGPRGCRLAGVRDAHSARSGPETDRGTAQRVAHRSRADEEHSASSADIHRRCVLARPCPAAVQGRDAQEDVGRRTGESGKCCPPSRREQRAMVEAGRRVLAGASPTTSSSWRAFPPSLPLLISYAMAAPSCPAIRTLATPPISSTP